MDYYESTKKIIDLLIKQEEAANKLYMTFAAKFSNHPFWKNQAKEEQIHA